MTEDNNLPAMLIGGGEDQVAETPKRKRRTTKEDRLRAEISAEIEQQAAIEQFKSERPDLWIHVQRVARLMEMQAALPESAFPPGSCFVHTGLPDQQVFSIKQLLEINLETCTATLEIYEDSQLEEGIVILPIESITWLGFPTHAIPLTFELRGLTLPEDSTAAGDTVRMKTRNMTHKKTGKNTSTLGTTS